LNLDNGNTALRGGQSAHTEKTTYLSQTIR